MDRKQLFEQIKKKESYLCVGLDSDLEKIPSHLLNEPDPLFAFNRQIIDATIDFSIAYKPNLAFYEAHGSKGVESLYKTLEYIPSDVFKIADAKRGDIGNTSSMYAKAFFEEMNFDAITLSPYMGLDSVAPYLEYGSKWVIILALTSNQGSNDFQLELVDGRPFYEMVMEKCKTWASHDQMMFVVGATQPNALKKIRVTNPEHFFLIPGVGAQGGSLEEVSKNGFNEQCGLIVNSSRGIIYASNEIDFNIKAGEQAKKLQEKMAEYLQIYL